MHYLKCYFDGDFLCLIVPYGNDDFMASDGFDRLHDVMKCCFKDGKWDIKIISNYIEYFKFEDYTFDPIFDDESTCTLYEM